MILREVVLLKCHCIRYCHLLVSSHSKTVFCFVRKKTKSTVLDKTIKIILMQLQCFVLISNCKKKNNNNNNRSLFLKILVLRI